MRTQLRARLIALGAIALMMAASGCAYLRPPASDRAVWEHQQKPNLSEGEIALYEFIQGLWLMGNGW